ncbi:hypothetical protein ATE84_2798 [Aquimarina sp. MAR_2010_214]|uniref:hypothetical protein n=1 Tax=Aquimarina sp. MAR_2010_214 TaxID=1250026 RepID=UPI000C70EF96|nr:hypothetical protein [Aquimarina sp. MAR_2010_214]PKV50732.1 hypothetical protein ATE84_2798 [Aquimarina sp. MAR_2010_214]
MKKEDNNYYRVNWVDGMKINKNRFIDMENALFQFSKVISARGLNTNNYGLLPDLGSEEAVKMIFSMDGQETIKIQLVKCRAITSGGHLIYITPEISSFLENEGSLITTNFPIGGVEEECYVVLSVNPYVRIPIGDSDPEEEPPRHPYVLPEYKLSIVEKSEVNAEEFGDYHITIGKIMFEEGSTPYLAEDFIPPCTSILSHQDLLYTYSEIGTFFNAIEKYSMNIIQKIYQKKQSNDLAKMVLTLCQNTLQYLGGVLPEYRINDKQAPPISMICKLISMARVIKNNLDIYAGTGKEELLNYLSDWCDLNQGAFENTLIEMIELQYIHTDINTSLNHVSNYTKLMLSLFKKLNELDYIGKKTDSNIFVKEEVLAKQDVKNRRSFLLD